MNENKEIIITLDNDKKYVLVSSLTFNEKKYVYLAELDDCKNVIIGELENDEIAVVEDKELFGQLILKFSEIVK